MIRLNVQSPVFGLIALLGLAHIAAAAPVVLDDFEDLSGWRATHKPAQFERAADAAEGDGAIHITMPGMVVRDLARSYVPGSADWDRYQGVSFWVKGDGSDQFGCVALCGRYPFVTYFPLETTEWHKLTVHLSDFVPEQQTDPIGAFGSMPASGIKQIRFGSRWTITHNNAQIPAHEYWVDHLQLEERVPAPAAVPSPRAFAEVVALLRARQPVRIQCMGDSITAGTGLPDRDRQRYATRVQEELRRWLGYEQIHCYSKAVGGAKLTDARAWVPRDFAKDAPDLVTMWYGYNDKSNAHTCDYFKRSLADNIDRVCRATSGQSAILLLATGPGCGPRFVMLDDYAEAVRETARERGLGLFDMNRTLKAIGRDKIQDYFGDMAHPNQEGHQLIADALCAFLVQAAGIDTPKPPPPPKPVVPIGKEYRWDFEDGAKGWTLDSDELTVAEDKATSGTRSLHFDMRASAEGHRHAFSPVMPVIAGQTYAVEGKTLTRVLSAGRFGLYVCTYPNAEGMGNPNVISVRGPSGLTGAWETLKNRIEVPEGAVAMKVMVWAASDAVATFYCDDIAVVPVE